MTCVECGIEATYWLCSNRCALAYSGKRVGLDCAVCSYDPKSGRIGRHDTRRLCPDCRNRPENQDWTVSRYEIPDRDVDQRDDANLWLRAQQDRPLPKITAVHTGIARLVIEGAPARVVYRDQQGRARGTRTRWRALTTREIANRVGCDQATVVRFIQHIEC